MDRKYQVLQQLKNAEAGLSYGLHVFGDHIAKREKYRSIDGIQAVHFYLMQKYHWLPAVVRSMSDEDLRFCLTEEMDGWVLPGDARE
ncbi:MAG: hypothetical protein EOQ57_34955 [Mesorhizobium sp.]|nr:MAG: hypothetical protein EOQ57_34955 [Mesorhizobium sp.]TGV18304.1 hypothetical protein EN786_33985 [Mesorhizobium sp. M4B.F.Ca.ET.143.01.1.1]TIU23865.1 MAG: hypothetical protein E5W49_02445 [Mesorhizobium sp.]